MDQINRLYSRSVEKLIWVHFDLREVAYSKKMMI